MKVDIDPKVKVAHALSIYGNNQSHLAKALEISRSSVNVWVKTGRTYVPDLQAYRLIKLHPNLLSE